MILDGVLIDQNPAARLATPAQRIALAWRDKHCTFPGCSRPPTFSLHAHHREALQRSGPEHHGEFHSSLQPSTTRSSTTRAPNRAGRAVSWAACQRREPPEAGVLSSSGTAQHDRSLAEGASGEAKILRQPHEADRRLRPRRDSDSPWGDRRRKDTRRTQPHPTTPTTTQPQPDQPRPFRGGPPGGPPEAQLTLTLPLVFSPHTHARTYAASRARRHSDPQSGVNERIRRRADSRTATANQSRGCPQFAVAASCAQMSARQSTTDQQPALTGESPHAVLMDPSAEE